MAIPTEDELKKYPKGQLTCEGSQMMQSTMGRFSFQNGATMKHTMAKKQNGVVMGLPECTGTIEVDVAEDGLEQDWIEMTRSGQVVVFQYEIPTLNCEIQGVLTGLEAELPMDGAVKFTINWTGKLGEPTSF